jgi:hypothetical protein
MASEPNKSDNPSAERLSKPEGFDTKKNRPGSTAGPDAGAVPPVHHVPDAGPATPSGSERKRRKRFTQLLSEPERVLAKDAAEQAWHLKREHRALYAVDPRRFRKIVRLAQSAVFRQKPGPKPDRKAPGASLMLPGGEPVARNGKSCTKGSSLTTGSWIP